MARDGPPKKTKGRGCGWCRLITAKVVLCVMNVASFALASGLVAVGSRKARNPACSRVRALSALSAER
jgi:hypothetical protein